MRALVTGGAGFIGSHVARHLLADGAQVVVLDDLSSGLREVVPDAALFVEGSITDHKLVGRLFAEHRFDKVFHLAAYAAEGLSHFVRRFNYQQNVVGSVNLINEAVTHGVDRFVFASSIAVYGRGTVPMLEDMTPAPEDPYGIAKYAVEMDLKAAHQMFGLEYVIVRPHNVYGEHQHIGDRYRNVIGIFMNQAMRGEPMTIIGDGKQTRAYTHVDDVAPYIVKSASAREAVGETFNLGADTPYTVLEIAAEVSRAFNVPLSLSHLPARPGEPREAYSNHEKARSLLGTTATIGLREGIGRMAAWARQSGPRTPTSFNHIEVTRNLPAHWQRAADVPSADRRPARMLER